MNNILKFNAPGSKSVTNRILIIAALTNKKVTIKNILLSEDTLIMLKALKEVGVNISFKNQNTVIINGYNKNKKIKKRIYAGYAGTVYRFLLAFLLTQKNNFYLQGEKELHNRPINELLITLNKILKNGSYKNVLYYKKPAIKIINNGLKKINEIIVDAKKSSQFYSALLLILPYITVLQNKKVILKSATEIVSKTYIDLTIDIMKKCGAEIVKKNGFYTVEIKPEKYNFKEFEVEGDYSGASYFMVLPCLLNKTVEISNLNKNSKQGDMKLLSLLKKIGCTYSFTNNLLTINPPKSLTNKSFGTIDMSKMQDLVPTVAVTAAFLDKPTKIINIENLKYKECDRFNAIITELKKIGVNFNVGNDFFEILPDKENYKSAILDTYKDHRLVMAFSLLSLKISKIKIKELFWVCKTFPGFFKQMEKLYKNNFNKNIIYSPLYKKIYHELF